MMNDRPFLLAPRFRIDRTDILFVITDLAVGGAENQVQDLALRLSARGWRVALVSMIAPTISTQHLADAGVEVTHLGMPRGSWNPWAIAKLRAVIRRERPQVIHSHMIHANLLARLTRPVSLTPALVCTSHSVGLEGRGKEALLRLTDRLAETTTHVSRVGLERYEARRLAAHHRATWIPNGIDLQHFDGSGCTRLRSRQELGVPDTSFLWLAVGVFRPMKAFDRLVRAFSDMPENAQLVLVGDGPQRQEIAEVVEELDLSNAVTLLGARDDVGALMGAADAFVLSSTTGEALPLVLLEAASSKLPIVTTDVGGCKEIVRAGVNGTVVPPSDSRALGQAMREMMALPEDQRRAMGERGRELVMEEFDIERVVAQWEALYRGLIAGGAK